MSLFPDPPAPGSLEVLGGGTCGSGWAVVNSEWRWVGEGKGDKLCFRGWALISYSNSGLPSSISKLAVFGNGTVGPGTTQLTWVVRQLEQEWKCHEIRIAQSWLCLLLGLPTLICSPRVLDEGLRCRRLPQTCGIYLETPSSGSRRAVP